MALFYKPYNIYFIDNYKKIKIQYPLQVQKCNVKYYKMIIKTKCNSMDARETGSFRASSALFGALTVEASLILPIMIFALTSVIFILQIIGLWNHLGQVSADSVRRFSAMAEWGEDDSNVGLYPIFLSGLEYNTIEKSGVYGGVAGLYVKPEVDNSEIHLDLSYTVHIPFGFIRLPLIHLNQQTVVKRWTGLQSGNLADRAKDNGLKVYVAENGSVYHKDRECTHLKLSIQAVTFGQLDSLRNEYGGKYHQCETCNNDEGRSDMIYITKTGDRYHSQIGCSGLKRTIREVDLSDAESFPPCSRCCQD